VQWSVATRAAIVQAWVGALEAALAPVPETAGFSELEAAVEGAVRQAGAASLTAVLAERGTGYEGRHRACPCGGEQETDHYASCHPQTVLGEVTVQRAAYHCAACGRNEYPLDAVLGLPAAGMSPRLEARLSLLDTQRSFEVACALLTELTGIEVSVKQSQLVSEALGAAVEQTTALAPPAAAPPQVPARLYLGMDGVMYCTNEQDEAKHLVWREAKTAVFYEAKPARAPGTGRQSRLAPEGPALDVAQPGSQSYVVHLGDWRAFAQKVWPEGVRRGLEGIRELIVLSDGAEWINALIDETLAGLPIHVVHILDLRHAEEHLWAVARACLSDGILVWVQEPLTALREGRVDDLAAAIRTLPAPTKEAADLVTTTVAYYLARRAQMAYPAFRAQGYQIGSGLAESACKRVIGERLKGPGMHWTTAGAQAIATLRAAWLSGRWAEVVAIAEATRSRRPAA
jgi:hypothetical protein